VLTDINGPNGEDSEGWPVRIRRLSIQNYRGIKSLDWRLPLDQRLITLVGPGDSGKSTILEAIHNLLGDRWNITVSDTDFYGASVDSPIMIWALLDQLPEALMRDTSMGLWLSGVDATAAWYQDPTDELEPALAVRLTVDASLEPRWHVVRTDRSEQFLTSTHRRAFSTFKVDDRTDAQLRWSRTSPLGRLSGRGSGERDALAAASRAARDAIAAHEQSSLTDLASMVQERANQIGGGNFTAIRPGLDTSRSAMGASLALYEDVVPLTGYGLGSRRLASLAIQQLAAGPRSVAVVDEVEAGLEPHRAVRLLTFLMEDDQYSQVIVTTHSPVIVEQAKIENLASVQNRDGEVTITALGGADAALQRLRRARPSSLLAKKVVVVEGKTEHGLVLEFLDHQDKTRAAMGLSTSAGEGVAVQDGTGGSEVPLRSEALARLGFEVAAFCDNDDRTVDDNLATASSAGVNTIRWEQGHNTETQVCSELEADGLKGFLQLGVALRNSENTVLDDLKAVGPTELFTALDVDGWLLIYGLADVRGWLANAAIKRKWFKDVDAGRALGRWILARYDQPQLAATIVRLDAVQAFVYQAPPAGATPTDAVHDGRGEPSADG
jgi:hypothetical protein